MEKGGHLEVTQALLPAIRRSRGRIVVTSSLAGRLAQPTYGAYSGSKYALEAVGDALRREMAPEGVKVVLIEPGAVRTEMVGRGGVTARTLISGMTPEQEQRHGGLMQAILAQSEDFLRTGVDASAAAQVFARAITSPRPRARCTIGRDAAALTRLARFLPDRALDRVLASALRPHLPR
ncbi:SDR family NAD(P)-dependent oxidoreductase [Rathayibacter sp. Leaf296]|uniref:SDR family NAD(P)-dependent oxidoreductase n=1 Tax=Rathayibacter sp. Leaf296 TaxID=1736327 RepID=UPI003A598C66